MKLRELNRSFLLNRYMVTLGAIGMLVAVWNLYVVFNDDGIVAGRVVDPNDKPVAGASVTLYQKTLYVAEPRDKTTTDARGLFQFSGHNYYRIWLEAVKEDVGKSEKKEYRLYFRGQNLRLTEPLRVVGTR